jgi:hypothetical protein
MTFRKIPGKIASADVVGDPWPSIGTVIGATHSLRKYSTASPVCRPSAFAAGALRCTHARSFSTSGGPLSPAEANDGHVNTASVITHALTTCRTQITPDLVASWQPIMTFVDRELTHFCLAARSRLER